MPDQTAAQKLSIEPGTSLWCSHPSRLDQLGGVPDGVESAAHPDEATTAVVFADDADPLRDVLGAHGSQLPAAENIWIAYPTKPAGVLDRLQPILTDYGMRPVEEIALDDAWTALRFEATRGR